MEEWNKALKAYYYHKKEHFETLPKSKKDIFFWGTALPTIVNGLHFLAMPI
jgi:hypothetical protein